MIRSDSIPLVRRSSFGTGLFSLLTLPLSVLIVIRQGDLTYLDTASAILHKTGAYVFSLFGTFGTHLGGILVPIIVPALFVFQFKRYQYRFGIQVFLFWLGQNLVNMSFLARSAFAGSMSHAVDGQSDWAFLFDRMGIQRLDVYTGYILLLLGILCFAVALLIPVLMRQYRGFME